MKLLLINPDYMKYSSPPLGFISLAAYVRRECPFLNLKFLDQYSEKDILKQIISFSPDIIGFTAVSENYFLVKKLAEKIRRFYPKSMLVLGGIHISTSPSSFQNSSFDFAIRGEGEIAFTKFLNCLNNKGINPTEFKKIKGLMFRNKEKVIDNGLSDVVDNLDKLPLSARDLLNSSYYRLPTISGRWSFDPAGPIITSRGCPHNCRFCSSYALWKSRIRFFSAERVVEEIEVLYKKYQYRRIIFVDDVFTINKPRIKKIIFLLKKKSYFKKLKFIALGRADTFDEETARLLRELNVVSVTFGIETGSQKVLTYLKRGRIKIEDGVNAIKLARKYGMMGGGFFMIGSPFETKKDMGETYNFIKNYCNDGFAIHQVVPLPGTEVWDYALQNKIIREDFYDNPQKDFVDMDANLLLSKEVTKDEFKEMFWKIKSLHLKKNKKDLFDKLKTIRFRHFFLFFTPVFLKKIFLLKDRFLKNLF